MMFLFVATRINQIEDSRVSGFVSMDVVMFFFLSILCFPYGSTLSLLFYLLLYCFWSIRIQFLFYWFARPHYGRHMVPSVIFVSLSTGLVMIFELYPFLVQIIIRHFYYVSFLTQTENGQLIKKRIHFYI